MTPFRTVTVGDVFSTGSAHAQNLRRLQVTAIKGDLATCLVAHGPNGKFYNSTETTTVQLERLLKNPYRRSRGRRRTESDEDPAEYPVAL